MSRPKWQRVYIEIQANRTGLQIFVPRMLPAHAREVIPSVTAVLLIRTYQGGLFPSTRYYGADRFWGSATGNPQRERGEDNNVL